MIRYTLNCANDHTFESWFPGSDAFDKQVKRGFVTCPECGKGRLQRVTTVKGSSTNVRWRCSNCDAVVPLRKRKAS